MANASAKSAASEVPPAHEGANYPNPSSKPLEGPVAATDRADTQRLVWKVFFVLILCVVAMGVVLGLVFRQP
jgi:hypothetical protein